MTEASSLTTPSAAGVRARAVRARLLRAGLLVGVLVAAGLLISLLFPLYWRDRVADRVVRVVALDWRDFGQVVAEQRLHFELARAGLAETIRPADCSWVDDARQRRVECTWSSHLSVPGTPIHVPVRFVSTGVAVQ